MAGGSGSGAATREPVPHRPSRLFYFVLLASCSAYFGSGMPIPFLPLILKQEFHQSGAAIGLAIATYPLGVLVATPLACRVARSTERILRLHAGALAAMAAAALLFSACGALLDLFGSTCAMACVVLFRFLQGVGGAFYLAANTSLIMRRFPGHVAYVVGMAEVAVGCGAQLGRVCGGFLYDKGGFACPFWVVASLLTCCAVIGLTFEDSNDVAPDRSIAYESGVKQTPRGGLWTLRVGVACLAVESGLLMSGFFDATLPQHLEDVLGPIPISVVSLVVSIRSLWYLVASYWVTLAMERALSFEALIILGTIASAAGMALAAPARAVSGAEAWAAGTAADGGAAPATAAAWTTQLVAIVVSTTGYAMLFIPSLPLMQSEARTRGLTPQQAEETASLFMMAMSSGEALGPLLGGWLVGCIGFRSASSLWTCIFWVALIMALFAYDRDVVAARRRASAGVAGEEGEAEDGGSTALAAAAVPLLLTPPRSRAASAELATSPLGTPAVPLDSEGPCFHRLPFALSEARRQATGADGATEGAAAA